MKPVFRNPDEIRDLTPRAVADVPVLRYTLETIEYFLHETQGRVPVSWSDIQAPINVAGGLVDITQFLLLLHDEPGRARVILSVLADEVIRFTKIQSDLIGAALARPGHGFASARTGAGIGLSTDNIIMVSPAMFADFCNEHTARIGEAFGGTAFHSCGNWGRWLPAVKKISNLIMVDGAFSPKAARLQPVRGIPRCAGGTGVILHTRIVGEPEALLARVKRLWKPGLKLIVVTHVQDPRAQHQLYRYIHELCGE